MAVYTIFITAAIAITISVILAAAICIGLSELGMWMWAWRHPQVQHSESAPPVRSMVRFMVAKLGRGVP